MPAGKVENCACFIITLKFCCDDGVGNDTPEIIKAKVYFRRECDAQVNSILEKLKDFAATAGSKSFIKPEMIFKDSLLDSDAVFDGEQSLRAVSGYQDIHFDKLRIPVVMIQVIDKLQHGRVTALAGGLRKKEELGIDLDESNEDQLDYSVEWTPSWQEVLKHSSTTECGSTVTNVFPSPSLEFADENDSGNCCDVIRFYYEFRTAEVKFLDTLWIEDYELHVFNSKTSIAKPQVHPKSDALFNGSARKPNFPLEIWLRIFEFVPSRIQALTALSGVCRDWRKIFSHPFFWSIVDLKPLAPHFNQASLELFEFLLKRCSKNLRHLRLSWITTWPESLKFDEFFNRLEQNSLTTLVADNCLCLTMDNLESICKSQRNIENLRISGCSGIDEEESWDCLKKLHRLRRLSLGGAKQNSLAPLSKGKWPRLDALEFVDLPLDFSSSTDSESEPILQRILLHDSGTYLRNLRAVNIEFPDFSDFENDDKLKFLRALFTTCTQMEEFFLCQDEGLEADVQVEALIGHPFKSTLVKVWPKLRRISTLMHEAGEPDRAAFGKLTFFEAFAQSFSGSYKLERIDLMYNAQSFIGELEKWDLRVLLSGLPNLPELVVWNDSLADQADEIAEVKQRFPACNVRIRKWVKEDLDDDENEGEDRNETAKSSKPCACGSDNPDECPENSFRPDFEPRRKTAKRRHSEGGDEALVNDDSEDDENVENFFVILS